MRCEGRKLVPKQGVPLYFWLCGLTEFIDDRSISGQKNSWQKLYINTVFIGHISLRRNIIVCRAVSVNIMNIEAFMAAGAAVHFNSDMLTACETPNPGAGIGNRPGNHQANQ